ncbi:TetR family transcriptional regulator [Nocardia zapadnayensis]|uniref:TetR/AcrR family transcriptional regulator n=1 Tax=Nocardia rhamnosiphila TaxID=426716 RepID=UPI00224851DB|nr:TetR family transcriptional regulator [Nocardia zapadnayensis]MCX0275458.1 TetR family transcriptional regulator [Nocardia zapadnayensis]
MKELVRMAGKGRRADALRNREAIVAATRALVVECGPGIGMDEIAAAAGIAVGTLYRHFPSKRDLIDGAVADLAEAIARSLDAASARVETGAGPAIDELLALLRSVVLDMKQERLFRFAVAALAEDALGEIRVRGRLGVERLVAAAHREGSLYPDITTDDVVLLLATVPADTAPEQDRLRWLELVRRALTPISPRGDG